MSDQIRLCHVFNYQGGGGGPVAAKTLMDGWVAHPDIDPIAVHAANIGSPENFITEEPGYPVMYPGNISEGLAELDPDIVFIHGYSPTMNRQLKETSERDDVDAKFILRKGMNLFEHWIGVLDHGDPSKTMHQVTNLAWHDLIICPTQAVVERMADFYGQDVDGKLAKVPNAIDRSEMVPSSYMQHGWLRVITASRIAPNNYILSPLMAVARIIQADTFPVKLDMYGPANPAHTRMVESIAEDFDQINAHGKVDHDVLLKEMEAADVVCVPSISHQAVPLAAVEGMATGNVVLCGFPEAREDDALIHLPATHPPAWRHAIEDAYQDPDDAREWVKKGIEGASKYELEKVVGNGYVPLFHEILDDE